MDATEEKIITAARQLFLTNGYAATSTSFVAVEAGINKALIHYYFRTKKQLYQKVIESVMEVEIIPALQRLNEQNSLKKRMKRLQKTRNIFIKQYPRLPLIIIDRQDPGHEVILEAFRKHRFSLKPLQARIAEWTENSSFKRSDSGIVLMAVLSIALFPYLFRDIMQLWLDVSNTEYDNLIDRIHRELLGTD